MFCSFLGSGRRRGISIVYALSVLTFVAGMAEESHGYYCRYCGLGRGEGGITWFGRRVSWYTHYHDSEFHRLYCRTISPNEGFGRRSRSTNPNAQLSMR